MHEELKQRVLEANLELFRQNLVIHSWGNASGRDPETGHIVIKPSGIPYSELKSDQMVVLDQEGKKIEGAMNPSSDAPTHLVLYRHFSGIGGVVHTHSEWATSWAQAGRNLPPYGTTHADYFYGEIPCVRKLTQEEVESGYEDNTGKVIVSTFSGRDYESMPGALVHGHGPFTWGKDVEEALQNAVVLEAVARMAFRTELLGRKESIDPYLLEKHYRRKHGKDAYYGQSKE